MKKIIWCLFVLMFCHHTMAAVYLDEVQERTVAQQERVLLCGSYEAPIRVVAFMNYPPFGWKETEYIKDVFSDKVINTYYGMGVELFRQFAKEHRLSFMFSNALNYQEAKHALAMGAYDILLTDYYDDTYKDVSYFRPGYVANPIVIVTLKSNAHQPKTLQDLAGKKGYVRKEEVFYNLYRASVPKNVEIIEISGAKRAFYGLLKKKVDFILMSKYAYETEIRRFKIEDYVTSSDQPVFSPYIFMSYNRNNPCALFIKDALEKSLQKYTSDSQFMKAQVVKQLDAWHRKFLDEKSLLFETGEPQEDENLPVTSDTQPVAQPQQSQ